MISGFQNAVWISQFNPMKFLLEVGYAGLGKAPEKPNISYRNIQRSLYRFLKDVDGSIRGFLGNGFRNHRYGV